LPYRTHPVDLGEAEQTTPDYLAINPNGKIPTIVDTDGPDGKPITVFESGAILIYLAEKTGRFLPADPRGRTLTLQWLMFQMGGIGPMLGQLSHFRHGAPEPIRYAIARYENEAHRLFAVLDHRLGEAEYLAGVYTIADIATWPWVSRHEAMGIDIEDYPNLRRWLEDVGARPAVHAGAAIP
jgi:GST-like protein